MCLRTHLYCVSGQVTASFYMLHVHFASTAAYGGYGGGYNMYRPYGSYGYGQHNREESQFTRKAEVSIRLLRLYWLAYGHHRGASIM